MESGFGPRRLGLSRVGNCSDQDALLLRHFEYSSSAAATVIVAPVAATMKGANITINGTLVMPTPAATPANPAGATSQAQKSANLDTTKVPFATSLAVSAAFSWFLSIQLAQLQTKVMLSRTAAGITSADARRTTEAARKEPPTALTDFVTLLPSMFGIRVEVATCRKSQN